MKKEHTLFKRCLSILLSITMIVGLIVVTEPEKASEVQAAESTNLITNGGFETGVLSQGYSGASVITTPVHSGNYAAKIDAGATMQFTTDGANGGALMDANKQYKLSAYVYAEADSTIQLFMPTWETGWRNAQTDNVTITLNVSANQWTLLEYYVPIKEYQSLSQPRFNNVNGGAMYIDDIVLEEWDGGITLSNATVAADTGFLTIHFSALPDGFHTTSPIYYNIPIIVDGVSQTAHMEVSGSTLVTHDTSWYNGSNGAATSSIVILKDTIIQQCDPDTGWAIVDDGYTLRVVENYCSQKQADGTWLDTEYNNELTLSFAKIDGGNNWMFNRSEVMQTFLDGRYYQFDAYVDGVLKTLWLEFSGNETYIYAGTIGTPTASLRIPAGTVLTESSVHINEFHTECLGRKITLTDTLYVEKSGDTWQETTWIPQVTFDFSHVDASGNWWINRELAADYDNTWYQAEVVVDGNKRTAWIQFVDDHAFIYGQCFEGNAPTTSLLIEKGTVLYETIGNGEKVTNGKELTVSDAFYVICTDGVWAETTYSTELTLTFSQIDRGNNWMFNRSSVSQFLLDGRYYHFDAYVDGVLKSLWLEFSGNETYIYAGTIGTPTASLRIPAGTVLTESSVHINDFHTECLGRKITLTDTLYVEKSGDTWQETTWVPQVTFNFSHVDASGNWWMNREIPADYDDTWYQAEVVVDGNKRTAWIQFVDDHAFIYGQCFEGNAPTTSLLIEKGTVLYETIGNGEKVTNGKELTVSNQFYVVCTDGTWTQSVLTFETGIGLNYVEVDNSWFFNLTDTSVLSTTYYKLPVILDGKETYVVAQNYNGGLAIWPSFFTVFDGSNSVPTSSLVIEKNTNMIPIAIDVWTVLEDENEVTITNDLALVTINNAWVKEQATTDITLGYISSGSNNWQLSTDATIDSLTYFITTITIDGKDVIVPIEKNDAGFLIWSKYFTLVDSNGTTPTQSFVIKEGAILQQIAPTSATGWSTPIANGQWYKVTNELEVLALGSGWSTYSKEHDTSATPIYYCIDNDMSYMVTSSAGAYEITKDGVEVTTTELTEVGTYDITRIEQDTKFVQKVVLYKSGDAHADTTNMITAQDLVAVKKAALVENTNTLGEQFAADINRSGSVDAFDAKVMRRALISNNAVAYLSKVKGNSSLNGEMPIIGFDGPDTKFLNGKNADTIYSMIKELGFNTVLLNRDQVGTNYAWSSTQLSIAEKYGLKLYLNDGYINDESNEDGIGSVIGDTAISKLSNITSKYEGYSSFGGYFIEDEPMYNAVYNNKKQIDAFDVPLTSVKGYTNIHSYLNMAPYIAGQINEQLGGSSSDSMTFQNYKTYVNASSTAGVEALSYDMYLRGNGSLPDWISNMSDGSVKDWLIEEYTAYKIHTEDFWINLDWMSTIAKADSNKNPFYAFVQVGNDFSDKNETATEVTNLTTIQEMYFEANAALAMGAKGINYYSLVQPEEYVTSKDTSTDYTRSGLINYLGEKNNGGDHGVNYQYYNAAKKINAYIKAVDEVLMNATSTAVVTTNSTVASYLENEVSSYGSIKSINNEEVLVGCFDYFGQEAFMVVNITPDAGDKGSRQTVTLTFDGAQSGKYIEQSEKDIEQSEKDIDMNYTAWQTLSKENNLSLTIPAGEAVVIVLD